MTPDDDVHHHASAEIAFGELSVLQLVHDPERPRQSWDTPTEEEHLQNSIAEFGLLYPILVSVIDDDRFLIIDGHRRHSAVLKLGLETIPCIVYPPLSRLEVESIRFMAHTQYRPWTGRERSDAIENIRRAAELDGTPQASQASG